MCFVLYRTCSVVGVFMLASAVGVADDSSPKGSEKADSVAEQIKGEWVSYRDTPNGRYMTIKEHTGDITLLTTYDPNQVAVYSHRSEYRIDDSGNVNIFRYRNQTVLVGPNAGAKDKRDKAYLFRIEGDRFIEVHGMMKGDQGMPSLKVWTRLKENPIPKPQA